MFFGLIAGVAKLRAKQEVGVVGRDRVMKCFLKSEEFLNAVVNADCEFAQKLREHTFPTHNHYPVFSMTMSNGKSQAER